MSGKPILIAGPTASGKSSLALALAQRLDGAIINADALQVYAGWRVLTARPSVQDEAACPHYLYGHVAMEAPYSVGHWLREMRALLPELAALGKRPIIVGGTGLYFTAATQGLAEIPEIPAEVRRKGDAIRIGEGAAGFKDYLQTHDPDLMARVDQANTARLQRAWEVHKSTGRALSAWQADTGDALIPETDAVCLHLAGERDWLAQRIETRFGQMVGEGGLDEVRVNHGQGFDPTWPSMQALGARELAAFLDDSDSLEHATELAVIATRQYAKRQRSWFRGRMASWTPIDPAGGDRVLEAALQVV